LDILSPQIIKRLSEKYEAQTNLYIILKNNFNAEIKNYNFDYIHKINQVLTAQIANFNIFENPASQKDIENAIRAVWKRTHPNK
jgi:hypothetical protein